MITELLKKVCKELENKDIDYMLSGSLAMNIYTVPRMTRDIDIVINIRVSDIEKFVTIFKNGFYIYEEGLEEEIKNRRMFNVIDNDSGFKIDFIVRKNTEFHLNEFKRRERKSAFGFKPWVVTVEDLIISKLKWIQDLKSDTQISDIENLLSVPGIDKDYIKKWCQKLDLITYDLI
ncbi:hypothetical protein [Gracilimonas sp.]|uniref:hypothetical protein n=1 Tax=Gracilimonas sp. TaxID=1974203 RepID=UPI0032ED93B4